MKLKKELNIPIYMVEVIHPANDFPFCGLPGEIVPWVEVNRKDDFRKSKGRLWEIERTTFELDWLKI